MHLHRLWEARRRHRRRRAPRISALACGVGLALVAMRGTAGAQTLTFEQALARAREQAARVVAADVPLNDADARMALASRRITSAPSVEAIAGGSAGSSGSAAGGAASGGVFDASRFATEITATQMFDVGARRTARIGEARAGVASDRARATDLTRAWVREAALLFVRALHAQARDRLLRAAEETAESYLTVAERRYAAGDVAVLDVNVARASVARARADRQAAAAEQADVLGQLRVRLGLTADAPPAIDGSLNDAASQEIRPPAPETLIDHPGLAVRRSELDAAEAAGAAARALARPEIGGVAKYVRDQGTNTWLGGVALTLPIAARGREQQAIAAARLTRARLALDIDKQALIQEIRTAIDAHRLRADAARLLERDALPALEENDALARRSYEAGELSLTDSLAIRQQALDTRLSHLDRLLDAASSGVLAQSIAGVLR